MSGRFYRSQPIGSLLRPEYLREARRALRAGEISAARYKRVEDRAVDEALALQEASGLDIINDGEQRRMSFLGSLLESTEGLSRSSSVTQPWHEDDTRVVNLTLGLAVTGKVRRRRSLATEEFVYARARARRPIKTHAAEPDDAQDVLVAQGVDRRLPRSVRDVRRRRGGRFARRSPNWRAWAASTSRSTRPS